MISHVISHVTLRGLIRSHDMISPILLVCHRIRFTLNLSPVESVQHLMSCLVSFMSDESAFQAMSQLFV